MPAPDRRRREAMSHRDFVNRFRLAQPSGRILDNQRQ